MAGESGQKFDHVVSVMFENRTFDNLLGRLYQPGEVASFEGVLGKELTNPIPDWAEHGADRKVVPYGVAADMHVPNPDSGEDFQHVNTQLFGVIDPPGNRCVLSELMTAPFNAPADPEAVPTMDGFVADYISAFTAQRGRQPTYQEYAQIMTGYTPEQVPVISAIARGFATFDHWHSEVPSQTFTNRSFYHAASSSGFVVNTPYENFGPLPVVIHTLGAAKNRTAAMISIAKLTGQSQAASGGSGSEISTRSDATSHGKATAPPRWPISALASRMRPSCKMPSRCSTSAR